MNIDSKNMYLYIIKISDIIIAILSLSVSLWIYDLLLGQYITLSNLFQIKTNMINILSLSVYIFIYNITLHSIGIYDYPRGHPWSVDYIYISKIVLVSSSLLLIITVLFQRGNIIKDVILIFSVFTCIFTFLGRLTTQKFVGWLYRQSRQSRNILLIGWNKRAYDFAMCILEKPHLGCHLIGFLDIFHEERTNRRFDLYLEC